MIINGTENSLDYAKTLLSLSKVLTTEDGFNSLSNQLNALDSVS